MAPNRIEGSAEPAAANASLLHPIDSQFSAHYADLRRIAHSRLHRSGGGVSLDTTSLVNECYLKLRTANRAIEGERLAFLAYASRTMRSVIVDLVREAQSQRRGGDADLVTLNTALIDATPDAQNAQNEAVDILALNSALESLAAAEPRLAQVVELRYFGGLELTEIAELMDCHERTVRRDWEKAKLLLAAILS